MADLGGQSQLATSEVRLRVQVQDEDAELVIHEKYGLSASFDTGQTLWEASIVMARWLIDNAHEFEGTRVLELGCGCGLPSLALLSACQSCAVDASDADEEALAMARINLGQFVSSGRCRVVRLEWGADQLSEDLQGQFDHIITSDTCYRPQMTQLMLQTAKRCLKPGGTVWVSTAAQRLGVEQLLQLMDEEGLLKIVAPAEYTVNPLASGDDDEFMATMFRLVTDAFLLVRGKVAEHV